MLRRSEPQPVTLPTLSQRLQDQKPKGWAGPGETLEASAGLTAPRFPSKLQDRGGGERRSSRLRAGRCDPGGKALGVRHFGCLCRSVQLPREPPTETRGGGEAAAVLSEKGKKKRLRGEGGVGVGRRGDTWGLVAAVDPGNQGWSSQDDGDGGGGGRTNRLTEPGGGGSSGRSRNDAGREPPAQGERALQADPGKCEAPGRQWGGFSRYTGLSPLTSAHRAPGHPRSGPRLRTPSQAECIPSSLPWASLFGSRARDLRFPPPGPHAPKAVVPE